MIKELVFGILTEHQNKPLNKKRIKELSEKISTAISMIKDTPIENTEVKTSPKTVKTEGGKNVVVSSPEAKKSPPVNRGPAIVIAMPDGEDVVPYRIDK